jgi:hypothetical protein
MDFMGPRWNLTKLFTGICLGLAILACDSSGLDYVCSDPLGSEDIILRDSSIFCFSSTFDGCFIANITEDKIEVAAISILNSKAGVIIDVGIFNCLGDVNFKPVEGYTSSVPLILNHGYVVKLEDNTYGRFYFDSFGQTLYNSALNEVNIIWQYSF